MYGLNGNSKIQKCSSKEDYCLCILEKLMVRIDEKDLELMATIARRIWLRRNIVVCGGDFIYISQLVRSTKESMEEFHRSSHNLKTNM